MRGLLLFWIQKLQTQLFFDIRLVYLLWEDRAKRNEKDRKRGKKLRPKKAKESRRTKLPDNLPVPARNLLLSLEDFTFMLYVSEEVGIHITPYLNIPGPVENERKTWLAKL